MGRFSTDWNEPPTDKCECGDTGKVYCPERGHGKTHCDACIEENGGVVKCDNDERVPCPECGA